MQRLREARVRAGLTQEQVALRLSPTEGLAPAQAAKRLQQMQRFVSRCETGETRMDVLQLRSLCEALDLSFAAFIREFDDDLKKLPR